MPFSPPSMSAGASLAALIATAACSSDEPADATESQTREAALAVIASAEDMYPDASGEASVTVADGGTSVELTVSGLMSETTYVSHLHDATCETDPPGGEHWLADPDEGMSESNEIHLHFVTDADGNGSTAVDSDLVADDRIEAIVVHVENMDVEGHEHIASDRVLCGNFD
ncbi:hypothetical protein GCM10027447_18380 [Glycomyces halotolerans]